MSTNSYVVEYAKSGRASCKHPKCKGKIDSGELRVGKLSPNPFGDAGDLMTNWYHPACLFETFTRSRPGTKTIKSEADFESGWASLSAEDKATIKALFTGATKPSVGGAPTPKGKKAAPKKKAASKKRKSKGSDESEEEEEEESEEKPKKKATKGKKK